MQQHDLCMAPCCSISRHRAQLRSSTAATSRRKKNKKKLQPLPADGELMEGRDGADIPLLGCSVRIHVPCCFTMEEKQRPPDEARGVTWALPWRGCAHCLGCGGGGMGRGRPTLRLEIRQRCRSQLCFGGYKK